jgi:hypothetical protein
VLFDQEALPGKNLGSSAEQDRGGWKVRAFPRLSETEGAGQRGAAEISAAERA